MAFDRRTVAARRRESPPRTEGRLIHWAFLYDLLLRVLFVGKERAFRDRVADLARLASGESVLDVGRRTAFPSGTYA